MAYYYIYDGIISSGITLLLYDNMIIDSGGVANNTTVNSGGFMDIASGGVANSTTVNSWGYMYISSGGVANSTTVNDMGVMVISSGGTANSTTVNDWGQIGIYSGGVANNTTVNSDGAMYIFSGGTANNTTVNKGAMYISSGGTATNVIWTPCVGHVNAADGAYVTYASKYSGVYFGSGDQLLSHTQSMSRKVVSGSMYVFSGGVANSTTISRGFMDIYSGGVANSTTVNSYGYMYISSGGTVNNTTVKGGKMHISSGGTATNVIWTPCVGHVSAADGAYVTYASKYSGVYFGSGDQLLSHTQSMSGKVVSGSMYVMDGGVANNTSISPQGQVYVYAGGTVNSTTISGKVISSGNTTTTYECGMFISSGGVANSTTINGGPMFISSGGTANSTTVNSWGYMYISSGGVANSTTINSGFMYISSGGVANSTTVNYRGSMYISSGGVASNTTVYFGYMYISSGGTANSTTVNSRGIMFISSGGVASNTTVNSGGFMDIASCGTATNVIWTPCVGHVYAADGAYVTYASKYSGVYFGSGDQLLSHTQSMSRKVVSGSMYVFSGGTANNTTVTSYGDMYISSGGVARNTTVNSGGSMYIASGGTATNVTWTPCVGHVSAADGAYVTYASTYSGVYFGSSDQLLSHTQSMSGKVVSGTMYVMSGGVANNTTVTSYGDMYISSGGVHRGSLQIESGANVAVHAGAKIDFTVADRNTEDGYLINDLSLISGAPTYTITVSLKQEFGTYKLAQGASNFTGMITIGDGTVNYGSITVNGEDFVYNDTVYSLDQVDGNLSLTIDKAPDITPPKLSIPGNATTPTNQDVVLKIFANENCTILYNIDNGEWQTYYGGIIVTANGTVNIKATDEAGNVTEKSVIIDKIDKIAPNKPTAFADTTELTNQNVTVNATFSSDSVVKQYSFDNKTWKTYSSSVVMEDNGTVYFRSQDEAGNYSEVTSFNVTNIDKVAPTLEISGNATVPTNQDVVLTATASDGTVEYFANGKWNKGNSIIATENGTYQFRVTDAAGNITEKSVTVDMIDKVAPILEISGNATAPTNQDVVLTAIASDGTVEYYDGAEWVEGDKLTVAENGIYQFRVTDAAGNVTEKSVVVDKIDKVAPTLEISGNVTEPTNKDVVLTAIASDGTVEYYDGAEWVEGDKLTVAENGIYQFRVTDTAGNITEKSVVVDMIDKVAPTLSISGNASVPTNKDIVLTATASDGTVEYYDGAEWIEGNKLTVSENGTYQFRVTDAAGNITEKLITVNMIDKVAPTLEISGNVDTPTNQDVVLTATASDGTVEFFANGKWNKGNTITASENGTFKFRVTDAAGNVTEESVTVDMIDKVAPTLEISGNVDTPTNKDVVLTATASDGTIEYFADGKWNIGSSLTVTTNGTYQFRVTDEAGNVTEKSVVVEKIDKVTPTLEINGNPTMPTNQNVVLTATVSDGTVEYYDGAEWVEGDKLTVAENGIYQFRVTDAAGNVTEKSITVNMIDKVAPTLKISGNVDSPTNKDVVLTATASDGTIEYFANGKWNKGNSITATENGTYQFRVTDAAGNITEKSVTVDMIDKVAPTLEISGNATAPTNQDVVLTATASDGTVEFFANGKWNKGNTITASENGTFKFRVTDAAGNVTEKSVVVDMVDKVAPTLEISGNAIEPTNKDVVLTAIASDGTVEYFANGKWNSGNCLTVAENGTYQFRVTDTAGNITEKSVVVDKIDKVAPTLKISGNVETPTNEDVVLTATASDGTIEYFADGKWNIGSSLTVTTNGTYQFRVTDAAGNVTEKSVTVDMIDKVAPILEISGNATAPTNQDVVLTATVCDGTIEYYDGKSWIEGDKLTVSDNGTYKFRVTDTAGNVTEKSVVVDKIDKVAPTLEIFGNATEPTNQDVVLTATASDGTIEYFANGKWNKGNSITATENGTFKFRVTDLAGNVTEESVTVDMIDKVAPTLKVLGNVTKPTNNNIMLLATASDGVIEYLDGKYWIEGDSLLATENGTYKFRVTDVAGNVTEETVVVDMIDKVAPSKPVASADVTSETKDPVTVSAAFSNDSAVKQYSLDNKTWYNYTSGVVMESNGTVYFRGIDAAGNISAVASYEVNNIVAASDIRDNDLDGNGLADVILVHTKQGYSGAWLTTGDSKIIKWGSLSDIKSGTEILGTGKLVGSADDGQDIFFADSKTVGAWNVVEGKVTGYKTIMNVNATTNVIGLGDFNGDGATDLLLRSTSGDLGFYGTDGTGWEYLIGLGKEWSVAAVGDLNGDGLADTIVRHDAGFAGTFLTQTDGTVKWANLDTLAKDMTIVGTGDFNGDGVDDVLLQKDDGWVGAWLVEDGSVDSFMGICTNKSAIEQIADFNGDGIDDLRVRDGKAVGVLYVNGADSTTWQYFQSVGTEWDTSFSALA